MFKLFNRFLQVAAAAAFAMGFSACDDDDDPVVLIVDPAHIEVTAEGGRSSISYTLSGAPEGAKAEVKCDATWINSFSTDVAGQISFSVDENKEEAEREAKVTVIYRDLEAEVPVRQAAAAHVPGFALEIKDIYDAGVVYSVVPEDPEMSYMSMVALKSDVDAFAGDDEFFADEMEFFRMAAEGAETSLADYLASRMKKGSIEGPAYRLRPETEYYAYAYGLSPEGERLTAIYKTAFKTIAVERTNTVLDISYDISGTNVVMTITPDNNEQYYMYNMMLAAEVGGDADLIAATQMEIDNYIDVYERLFGVPQDEAVQRFASKGVNNFDFSSFMSENTEYVGYAVPVDRLGVICGDVVSKKFTTGTNKPVEAPIALTLTRATEREVTVHVETTISDHYVIGVDKAGNWTGMSDAQILDRLVAGYQWQAKGGQGAGDFTFYSLSPQTDYCIFAFGYVDGKATTDLCRLDLTTANASHADIVFHTNFDKYFDGTELAEKVDAERFKNAAGLAVLPVTLTTSGSDDCVEIYYGLYPGDYSDTALWPDSEFSEELLEYGYWESSKTFFIEYDKTYTMIGFGATADMALGEFGRQVIKLTRDGVSPYTEFGGVPRAGAPAKHTAAAKPSAMSLNAPAASSLRVKAGPLKPSGVSGRKIRTAGFRSAF